ncbi:DUF721 domain-containing protein [Athalassotoga sp.]|uniref:DUF721 domain-containing protein n=1 Tax=Athalassotoga sp. TaxID=2022597 RepID=UPI003D004C8C
MERELSKILDDLSGVNPFFLELQKRVFLNSLWKSIVGDRISAHTYICEGKDKVLEIWVSDPMLGSDLRFMSSDILSMMKKNGLEFKKIDVKRLRGGTNDKQ